MCARKEFGMYHTHGLLFGLPAVWGCYEVLTRTYELNAELNATTIRQSTEKGGNQFGYY